MRPALHASLVAGLVALVAATGGGCGTPCEEPFLAELDACPSACDRRVAWRVQEAPDGTRCAEREPAGEVCVQSTESLPTLEIACVVDPRGQQLRVSSPFVLGGGWRACTGEEATVAGSCDPP
jgi:hypothetical protein